jgi:hypothetical protein
MYPFHLLRGEITWISRPLVCSNSLTTRQILQGHYASALSHVQSGVKILAECRAADEYGQNAKASVSIAPNPFIDIDTLEVLITRLNIQAMEVRSPPFTIQPRQECS